MCDLTLKSYFLFISGLGGLFSGLSFKLAGGLWASLYKAGTSGFYNLLAVPLLWLAPTPRVCYNLFKVLTDGIIPILRIIIVIFLFVHWHSCRFMLSFISFRRKKGEMYLAQKENCLLSPLWDTISTIWGIDVYSHPNPMRYRRDAAFQPREKEELYRPTTIRKTIGD